MNSNLMGLRLKRDRSETIDTKVSEMITTGCGREDLKKK